MGRTRDSCNGPRGRGRLCEQPVAQRCAMKTPASLRRHHDDRYCTRAVPTSSPRATDAECSRGAVRRGSILSPISWNGTRNDLRNRPKHLHAVCPLRRVAHWDEHLTREHGAQSSTLNGAQSTEQYPQVRGWPRLAEPTCEAQGAAPCSLLGHAVHGPAKMHGRCAGDKRIRSTEHGAVPSGSETRLGSRSQPSGSPSRGRR